MVHQYLPERTAERPSRLPICGFPRPYDEATEFDADGASDDEGSSPPQFMGQIAFNSPGKITTPLLASEIWYDSQNDIPDIYVDTLAIWPISNVETSSPTPTSPPLSI